MPFNPSLPKSLIFLTCLILCFFPNTAIYLLRLPFSRPLPASAPTPSCPPSPTITMSSTVWSQKTFNLPPSSRGCHLVTPHITRELSSSVSQIRVGILHLFIQHTSCGLSLNENYDDDVRTDMADALDRLAPEDKPGDGRKMYRHSAEGRDDMPAHIKASLVGSSVSVPITDGELNLGTWQGIWYLEFRNGKQSRRVVATVQGEKM